MNTTAATAAALPTRSARRVRGFTLIETMVTVGIAGVLSSIAYPSLEGQVMRARRTDALVALMQAQLAQERFRANNAALRQPRRSRRARHVAVGPLPDRGGVRQRGDGYELLATAVAGQARDAGLPPRCASRSSTARSPTLRATTRRHRMRPTSTARCWSR